MLDARLANGETVECALSVIANCKGNYAGAVGCENCQERMRLIEERERALRERLAEAEQAMRDYALRETVG